MFLFWGSSRSAEPFDGVSFERHVLAGSRQRRHLQQGTAFDPGQSQQSQLHKTNGNGNIIRLVSLHTRKIKGSPPKSHTFSI